MKKRFAPWIIVGFLLMGWPLNGLSQELPSGKWWHSPAISAKLKLSPDEIRRLDDLYAGSRRHLIDLKRSVEKERFELDQQLGGRKMNRSALKKQHQKLEKARTDLSSEYLRFMVETRNIIGYDRFQQLKQIYRGRAKSGGNS
jgi:Spy/CpxP family protein refolding chaperone